MTTLNQRIYLDSYAMIGKRGPKDVETPYETEVLLEEMEWCGIHGALIAHWVAKEYDPMYGNRKLLHELKKSPRLYGVWTVMPSHTGEMPPPKDIVKEMQDNGIRAAKMYPRTHHYFFNEDTCGELLSELEKHEILLLLEGGHMYGPDILEPSNQVLLAELDAMLTRHPNLPVLLQGSRWDATRYLHTLMTQHKNLYLEFSANQSNRAMEVYAGWFGAQRLLFGTGALDKSPGAAKAFVDYCTLTEEEKADIAGRNLGRLLKLDRLPKPYHEKAVDDPILVHAKAGKPLDDILVIDAHAHIAHDEAVGTGFMHQPFSDDKSMFERAKLMGIDAMCISSWLGIWTDYEDGNEIVHNAMMRYPGFYHGYATLQPQYIKNWEAELRKVHEQYKMQGLKPYHPRTNIPYNDKLWAPWFEYGNRMNAYALLHPSPNFTAEINEIAPKYPNITFIIAHCGSSFETARQGIDAALKFPNVFLEITLTSVTYRVIEFMVKHVGAERVLFGTDQPMRDPIPQFGWMAYSHCTFEEKKKMFGLNMKKIIERVKKL
ncbi:MAG: amidohydrolase family protein [candidate division KSB1 bacterium]|nr:amidohydrolase family protein [candidate division KSB1 bacterium]